MGLVMSMVQVLKLCLLKLFVELFDGDARLLSEMSWLKDIGSIKEKKDLSRRFGSSHDFWLVPLLMG